MRRNLANDRLLFGLVSLAVIAGLFVVWDAAFAIGILNGQGIIPSDVLKHLLGIIAAFGAFLFFSSRNHQQLRKWAVPFFWGSAILCLLVLFPQFSQSAGGARRRLGGETLGFQPAELMKPATVLFLAYCATKTYPTVSRRTRDFIGWVDGKCLPWLARFWPLIAVAIAFVLIEREPDLGTALVVFTIAGGMMLFGLADKLFAHRAVAACCVLALLCFAGAYMLAYGKSYRAERLSSHSNRWDAGVVDGAGHQAAVAEKAMAFGGAAGIGVGRGIAKQTLPAATTDYAFVTPAEEFGILGSLAIIAILAGIALRMLILASYIEDPFRRILIQGTGWWIGTQSIFNILVAGAAVVPVGIPLPFFSYGNSSLLSLGIGLGICRAALSERKAKELSHAVGRNRRRHRRPRLSRA